MDVTLLAQKKCGVRDQGNCLLFTVQANKGKNDQAGVGGGSGAGGSGRQGRSAGIARRQ